MTPKDVKKIIAETPADERPNLDGAGLRGGNLRGGNLRGADLRGANLDGADLRWAGLRGANLRWAKGVYELDMADPRGYRAVAVAHAAGWMIASGCRWLTITEALAHWGNPQHGSPDIAARYVRAINALPVCPPPAAQ